MLSHHLLQNIETHRVPEKVLMSPRLGAYLLAQATEVATIYKGIVAKKTGRLSASATPYVTVGGHMLALIENDQCCSLKVTTLAPCSG